MYEIWLAANIVWEIALGIWPALFAVGLAWLALLLFVVSRPAPSWRLAVPGTVAVGLVAFLLAFVAVPWLTRSSLLELAYWVDWANLGAIAAGFGVAVMACAWPLLALRGNARV